MFSLYYKGYTPYKQGDKQHFSNPTMKLIICQ